MESKSQPGALSDPKAWTAITSQFAVHTEALSHEAEAELAFDVNTGEFISDLFYKIPTATHYKRGGFSLADFKEELGLYNRISVDIYPDMKDRASIWFEAVGAPRWTAATFPLKAGQWNRIWLNLGALSPKERQSIRQLMFGSTSIGRLPGDPQWKRYYLKNLRFENVLPRNISGWEISPAYVSLSQVGYRPWDKEKTALFSAQVNDDSFRLRELDSGKVCFQATLQNCASQLGDFKLADFSAFKKTGSYYIEAGTVRSPSFPISTEPFAPALENYLYWLSCMRSGCATPAHPDCFKDDALREDNKESIDLSGAWFDASDLRIYNSMLMSNILKPLADSEGLLRNSALNQPLSSEIDWGAEFFAKLWDRQSGFPYTMLCVHIPRDDVYAEIRKHYFKNNNYWTDNVKGTIDDRIAHTPWNSVFIDGSLDNYLHHLGICAAGTLVLSRPEHKFSAEQKQELLQLIENHFALLRDPAKATANRKFIAGVNLNSVAALAMSLEISLNLAALTGKEQYQLEADELCDKLLAKQRSDMILSPTQGYISAYFNGLPSYQPALSSPAAPVSALLSYLEKSQDTDEARQLRVHAALRLYANFFARKVFRLSSPYTLPARLRKDQAEGSIPCGHLVNSKDEVFASPTFSLSAIGHESTALTRLAAFLRDGELYAIAQAMLLPHLGFNPSSLSFVAETGQDYKKDMMSTTLGHMRGMTTIGIGMKKGIPQYPQHYSANEIYTQVTPYFEAMAWQQTQCELQGETQDATAQAAPHALLAFKHQEDEELTVFTQSDRDGKFSARLPAGGKYDVFLARKTRGKLLSEKQIGSFFAGSGKCSQAFNIDGMLCLDAMSMSEKQQAGGNAEISFRIINYADAIQSSSLNLAAHNLSLPANSKALRLLPGINQIVYTVPISSEAKTGTFVIMASLQDSPELLNSVCGYISSDSQKQNLQFKAIDINGEFSGCSQHTDEQSPPGWRKIMGPGKVFCEVDATGAASVRMLTEKTTQLHSKLVPVAAGDNLKFSFRAIKLPGSGLVIAGIHLYDQQGQWLGVANSRSVDARANWTEFEISAVIPEKKRDKPVSQASVGVGVNGAGEAKFSKLLLESVSTSN